MSAFLSPSNLQDKTSARLLTPPFHGGAESRGQMREQRDLTSPQMLHGKTHCVSMQPPPQSGVLLFAKHNRLAPLSFNYRVYGTTSHSHDNSPSLAATVCKEQPLSHMIIAPSLAATVCKEQPLIHMIIAPR